MLIKLCFFAASVFAFSAYAQDKFQHACDFNSSSSRWERVVDHAEFKPRDVAMPIQFGGYMWISNGYRDSKTIARDLWRSKDGASWELMNENTPYDPYSGMVVYKGAIYAVKTSVWRSIDGKKWDKINEVGPLENKNASSSLVVLKGKMLLISGNQIWSSRNGIKWKQEPTAPYSARNKYAVAVLDNAVYVMGGAKNASANQEDAFYPDQLALNDVWKSSDGRIWKQLTSNASWDKRMWPSVVAHKGKLVLVGGFDNLKKSNFSDTWLSSDGKKWCLLNEKQYSGRHWPSLFSHIDHVFIVAGNTWPVMNDVWKLKLP